MKPLPHKSRAASGPSASKETDPHPTKPRSVAKDATNPAAASVSAQPVASKKPARKPGATSTDSFASHASLGSMPNRSSPCLPSNIPRSASPRVSPATKIKAGWNPSTSLSSARAPTSTPTPKPSSAPPASASTRKPALRPGISQNPPATAPSRTLKPSRSSSSLLAAASHGPPSASTRKDAVGLSLAAQHPSGRAAESNDARSVVPLDASLRQPSSVHEGSSSEAGASASLKSSASAPHPLQSQSPGASPAQVRPAFQAPKAGKPYLPTQRRSVSMSHTNSSALSSSGLNYSLDAALFQKSPALSSSVSVASASSATSSAAPTSLTGRPISHDSLRAKYESILNSRNSTDRELRESLKKLRMLVVMNGMPDNSDDPTPQHGCSLKGRVWKCLLGVYSLSAKDYSRLIDKGPCDVYDKIKNDTFRTMATDRKFTKRVQENMLSRALNAFVWKVKELPTHRLLNLKFSYVQGMNVLMAPFLYCMPELDAFHAYAQFIQHVCPLYVQPAMEGVHCGVKLLEQCLKILDPELYSHLKRKKVEATVYAFPSVLTLCACTPPLSELLKLWDFLLAYGVHLNILCIVAQLMMMRTKLLSRPSPGSLLRTLPPLNAKEISAITIALVPQLPDDLYDWLARHPYDATIYEQMIPELEEEEKELGW